MRMNTRILAASAALGLVGLSAPAAAESPHWGYFGDLGPAHWEELDPTFELCGSGQAQSPINIGFTQISQVRPPQFQYRATSLEVVNNGHTIQFNVKPGSRLKLGDTYYELEQFHVHAPSEHEFRGRQLPLEIHLVHRAENGELAVVAVLGRPARRPHHAIQRLWEHLPEDEGGRNDAGGMRMNPITLLPLKHSFASYRGSLTTPPCTEGVHWLVMTTPLAVSDDQAERFRRIIGDNARPIQPLNGRRVISRR